MQNSPWILPLVQFLTTNARHSWVGWITEEPQICFILGTACSYLFAVSAPRQALSGRSGRGHSGEADKRRDTDSDRANDGEDRLPGG